MKFPSLTFLSQQATKAFKAYPMTILSASVAVFFGIYLIEAEQQISNEFPFINLLLCGYLGVPLFMAARTYSLAMEKSDKFLWVVRGLIVMLLVGVYFYLPGSEETLNKSIPYIRYVIFAVAAHLLVSFAPFLQRGSLNGFWHFNKGLFLRFLLSLLYSAFFYVGIVLALLAIKSLFDVDIKDERFFEIFIFIAGVFNTWFFVAGIPKKFPQLDEDESYPKGLRTFILYVLIPLLATYFVILYAYSAKIIFVWDWPRGIITYMIISVAVLGILAMLLAYPYSQKESKSPLTFLSRGYCWVLLPMIVMLLLAIGIRVSDYGVTINRYLTILLAIWLTFVSGYLIFFGKNIKLIPISLFLFILITSIGPWGIFKVSERSQINRLRSVLEGADILNGKINNEPEWVVSDTTKLVFKGENANDGLLTDSLHNEVMSILNYLEDFHGFNGISGWYSQDPKAIAESRGVSERVVYMRLMGLPYVYRSGEDAKDYYGFDTYEQRQRLHLISGFDYMIRVDYYSPNSPDKGIELDPFDELPELTILLKDSVLTISDQTHEISLNLQKKLRQLIDESPENYSRELEEKLILSAENDWMKAQLQLTSISAQGAAINYYRGRLLFGFLQGGAEQK